MVVYFLNKNIFNNETTTTLTPRKTPSMKVPYGSFTLAVFSTADCGRQLHFCRDRKLCISALTQVHCGICRPLWQMWTRLKGVIPTRDLTRSRRRCAWDRGSRRRRCRTPLTSGGRLQRTRTRPSTSVRRGCRWTSSPPRSSKYLLKNYK